MALAAGGYGGGKAGSGVGVGGVQWLGSAELGGGGGSVALTATTAEEESSLLSSGGGCPVENYN